ncbi:MAG TPA: hypothetical protein DEP23_06950 [Ruminococcaceae bacterium]|nr:hypothetical protein [Oscillospiraceae bacterium]
MAKFLKRARAKAEAMLISVLCKARALFARSKKTVVNCTGQGTLDVAVTVLISIVLGALILGGLYLIVNSTVLPTILQKIKDMFNYKG